MFKNYSNYYIDVSNDKLTLASQNIGFLEIKNGMLIFSLEENNDIFQNQDKENYIFDGVLKINNLEIPVWRKEGESDEL